MFAQITHDSCERYLYFHSFNKPSQRDLDVNDEQRRKETYLLDILDT